MSQIASNAAMVLGYVTGTPDIRWTPEDWNRFPESRRVTIDQGGEGSPVLGAVVRDVETGAWQPKEAAVDRTGWNVPRPTIYCNENTLPRILAAGWKGDLWLAIPSAAPPATPPGVPGCRVVAVQYRFESAYDESVIFDDSWPEREVTMSDELQTGWQHCGRCQGLFFGPNVDASVCPAGGHHDGTGSGNYGLVDEVSEPVTKTS